MPGTAEAPALAPDATALVSVEWNVQGQTGAHEIEVLADALGAVREFREDNLRQVNSPTIAKVGMRTLFAFEPSTRLSALRDLSLDAPWDTWRLTRRRVFVERLPYFLVAVGLWLALLAWALRRSKDWEALVLGVGLVPIAIEAASYYQVILVGYALLWPLHRLAGVFLAAAAGLTCLAPAFTGTGPMSCM